MEKPEQTLANIVSDLQAEQVPPQAQRVLRLMIMAVPGTGIAGTAEDGVAALRELLCEAGGAPQATTLVFGNKLPAHAAAQFNGTLCRALDFCDAIATALTVTTIDGTAHRRSLDIAPGFPGADLDDSQLLTRFKDCLAYAPRPPSPLQVDRLLAELHGLTAMRDVRELVPLLIMN